MGVAERRTYQFAIEVDYVGVAQVLSLRFECGLELWCDSDESAIFHEHILDWCGFDGGAAWHARGDMRIGEQCGGHYAFPFRLDANIVNRESV